MGSPKLLVHRLLVTVLAAVLGLGLLTATTPARSEPVGVPVPTFYGGTVTVLGATPSDDLAVPAALDGKTVTAIAAGYGYFLALTSDGKVTAWGAAGDRPNYVPAALEDKTVTAISAGYSHALALTSDGKVTAWGRDNDGETHVPATLDGKTVTAIAAGDSFSLAMTSDGKVTYWGMECCGLPDVPAVLEGKTVTAIAAGTVHALALTSDGKVTAWGENESEQSDVPAALEGKTVTAIAAGGYHSLALTSEGKVTAWGADNNHQSEVPPSLDGKRVVAIAGGASYSLALTSEGRVVAWGATEDGRHDVPAALASKVITAIAAGFFDSLVVATDFRAEGSPAISGTPTVGSTLSAAPSRYTAPPSALAYQWFADGVAIQGAVGATYVPTTDQAGKRLTVQVTATLTGRPTSVTTSAPTQPVLAPPTVQLTAAQAKLRRGQSATLSWSSTFATSVTASGGWTGPQAASGSAQVKPNTLGVSTYVLTAANAAGSTTAQVQVTVTRPAKRLKVTAAKGKHRAGTKVKITIRGLETGEKYTIRVGKKKYAGTAKNARPLVRAIPLPKAGGRTTIRVTGDQPDRKGAVKVRVVRR